MFTQIIPQEMSTEKHGGIIPSGKTPDSPTTALWQSYHQSYSNKAGGTGERNDLYFMK
jgi:hypothetical protein